MAKKKKRWVYDPKATLETSGWVCRVEKGGTGEGIISCSHKRSDADVNLFPSEIRALSIKCKKIGPSGKVLQCHLL